jgi:two-component system, chemotaxis family, protein-glutamate methylesterase/glutaminase
MSIKVIIVDDSAVMRQMIAQIVDAQPDMMVAGTAEDAYDAREQIKTLSPDVVLLDIEMPRMDGLTFLDKIMKLRPMPVVMVSTLTVAGGQATLKALELGAVDFVTKPSAQVARSVEDFAADVVSKVRIAASSAAIIASRARRTVSTRVAPPTGKQPVWGVQARGAVVAIGASTGGIEAITTVLGGLPASMPPVVIVQHLPQPFTRLFAARLDGQCALRIKEAEHGDVLNTGWAYIAPGGRHLTIGKGVSGFIAKLDDDDALNSHRPSVDRLFDSVAKIAGKRAVGVILSGMGADGAAGLQRMKGAGALTVGQDEASCVVYGMPRAAYLAGGVDRQVTLSAIAGEVVSCLLAMDRTRAR